MEVNLAPSHANIQRSTTLEHVHLVLGLVDRNRRRCICCFPWRVAFEEVQAVHVFLISFDIVIALAKLRVVPIPLSAVSNLHLAPQDREKW